MLRKDLHDLDTNGAKGDWCFVNHEEWIVIRWGDDPMSEAVVLPILPGNSKSWQWDGSREAPTLTPSILVCPNRWHGYLRNGKLETA